ncbi:pVIII [Falcon aviadenovirus A]|nr:pVIII [Falcon aviadenovirus A]
MPNVTPTPYVWKYNPNSGIPAGAQQNYGATVNWVLPGGLGMAIVAEELRARTPTPETYSRLVRQFEALSDQQPFAGPHETAYIASNVIDSGEPKSGLYPVDPSGVQRVQLAGGQHPALFGGRTEGKIQLAGGLTEGKIQLAGGKYGAYRLTHPPPRWCGASMAGNGLADQAETASESFKYFLRTEGPSQVVDVPGTYSRRQFMETFVPAVVPHPFQSNDPGDFPAYYSPIYKGRTAFEDTFWSWQ